MPTAPPDCTHDHSECRITIVGTRYLATQSQPVYDGKGVMIPETTPNPPSTINDCFCSTCGLQWTEEQGSSVMPMLPPRPKFSNVRRVGGG